MSLKYEPASEPLQIYEKQLFSNWWWQVLLMVVINAEEASAYKFLPAHPSFSYLLYFSQA